MSRFGAYPDGYNLLAGDRLLIEREGQTYTIRGAAVVGAAASAEQLDEYKRFTDERIQALTTQNYKLINLVEASTGTPILALGTLYLSSTAYTAGTMFNATISGATPGSTITATANDGTVLNVVGALLSGTFNTAGTKTITLTEELAGYFNSPNPTQFVAAVADGGVITPPTPGTLTATPATASIAANATAGTLISNIGNVPAGVTPSVTPNDGRFVIAGDATAGWKVVTGMSALSAGSVALTVAATGATSVGVALTITGVVAGFTSIGLMTDLDSDIDDVIGEALLYDILDERSDISLAYVSVASRNADAAPAQRVLLDKANRSSVPVGQMLTPTSANSSSLYDTNVANLATVRRTRTDFLDSVVVMRTALAAMPDKSHKIIMMGNLTDYAALLASPADAISPLTGVQLVNAKVIDAFVMGGRFPTSTVSEANVNGDATSANYAAANTPVPLYWSPYAIGSAIVTRILASSYAASDPYGTAWTSYGVASRESWDSIPVLHAMLGLNGWFTQSSAGNVTFNSDGTQWVADPAGKNYYLTLAVSSSTVRDYINGRVDAFMARYGTPLSSDVAFTQQPTVSPSSGVVGTVHTATPGVVRNGNGTITREWRFGGNVVSTALSYTSTAAGNLTYQEFATGTNASTAQSVVRNITVTAVGTTPVQALSTFTGGTTGTDIGGTQLDSGQTWLKTSTAAGSIRSASETGTCYPSALGLQYVVDGYTTGDSINGEADFMPLAGQGSFFARFMVSDNNNYMAVGWQANTGWRIGQKVSSTYTALSTTNRSLTNGQLYRLRWQVRNGAMTLWVDDVQVATNIPMPAALTGRGVGLEGAHAGSSTTLMHLSRVLFETGS